MRLASPDLDSFLSLPETLLLVEAPAVGLHGPGEPVVVAVLARVVRDPAVLAFGPSFFCRAVGTFKQMLAALKICKCQLIFSECSREMEFENLVKLRIHNYQIIFHEPEVSAILASFPG